jgi:hypothetical protein
MSRYWHLIFASTDFANQPINKAIDNYIEDKLTYYFAFFPLVHRCEMYIVTPEAVDGNVVWKMFFGDDRPWASLRMTNDTTFQFRWIETMKVIHRLYYENGFNPMELPSPRRLFEPIPINFSPMTSSALYNPFQPQYGPTPPAPVSLPVHEVAAPRKTKKRTSAQASLPQAH